MLEGVTIEQLRTLSAVVETGSFSAAARKLGRVQAAVSQSIDRLEAQLDLRLFDRTGRVPRLTAHGQAIVAAAGKVESGVEALADLVASLKQGVERTLHIVVDVLFPTESLVVFAKDFANRFPEVGLVLFTDVLSGVTSHVRDKQSSWGIALEDADMSDLERRPVAEVRLIPVAASGHPLALSLARALPPAPPEAAEVAPQASPGEADTGQGKGKERSLDAAALADSVQIVLGEHHLDAGTTGETHGVFSTRRWRVVDLATKQALIAAGLGWGHMPEHLVREDLRAGRLVELPLQVWGNVAPRRSLVLVWRAHAVVGPVARWAQEHLTALCRKAVAAPGGNHAA